MPLKNVRARLSRGQELALRFYRRLLQMGVSTPELWNNLGLCCFYASQYDMALSCLDRALSLASDNAMAEVWYNIGQVSDTWQLKEGGALGCWPHPCLPLTAACSTLHVV